MRFSSDVLGQLLLVAPTRRRRRCRRASRGWPAGCGRGSSGARRRRSRDTRRRSSQWQPSGIWKRWLSGCAASCSSPAKSARARACSSSHASQIRLKKSSGKMYALKSVGSTGPRRLLAAAHSRDSSSCCEMPAGVTGAPVTLIDGNSLPRGHPGGLRGARAAARIRAATGTGHVRQERRVIISSAIASSGAGA